MRPKIGRQRRSGPVSVSGLYDAGADDEVATVVAGRRRGEVDGKRNTVTPRDRPPVDDVPRRTVVTSADQLDHLRAADAELIGVSA